MPRPGASVSRSLHRFPSGNSMFFTILSGFRAKRPQHSVRKPRPPFPPKIRRSRVPRSSRLLSHCLQGPCGQRQHRPDAEEQDHSKHGELRQIMRVGPVHISFLKETRNALSYRHCSFHTINGPQPGCRLKYFMRLAAIGFAYWTAMSSLILLTLPHPIASASNSAMCFGWRFVRSVI